MSKPSRCPTSATFRLPTATSFTGVACSQACRLMRSYRVLFSEHSLVWLTERSKSTLVQGTNCELISTENGILTSDTFFGRRTGWKPSSVLSGDYLDWPKQSGEPEKLLGFLRRRHRVRLNLSV